MKPYYQNKLITIYNNDCLEVMDYLIEQDIKVDLIVTDPPYKITSRGSSGGTGGMLKTELSKKGKIFEHNDIEIDEWLPKLYTILKESGHIYIMCNNKNLSNYLVKIKQAGFDIFKTLIWDKQNKICNMYYMDSHEYIIFARKGKAKKINNNGSSSILRYKNIKTKFNNKNIHDTEKPIELLEELILNSSNENDLILEPFAGSFSTCIATEKNNRKSIENQ